MIQSPKEADIHRRGTLDRLGFSERSAFHWRKGGVKIVYIHNKFVDVHTALVSHLKSEPVERQTLSPYPSSSSASSVSLLRVNWDRAEVLMQICL